jgi:enoyl-CoA hydratase
MALVETQINERVASLTINRPEALNALNEDVLMELRSAIIQLEGASVVVITGSGEKAFVAGADIKQMANFNTLQAGAFAELGQGVIQLIEEAPFISIACVNGFALGGGLELALACDLIYCSDNAKFGAPETNLGIIPGFGATINLVHRVGAHRASELILRGHTISAEEAKNIGLTLEVFEKAQLREKVGQIAKDLSDKGIYSMLSARKLLRAMNSIDRTRAFQFERECFANLFSSDEPKEGMTAFVEKRKAKFH